MKDRTSPERGDLAAACSRNLAATELVGGIIFSLLTSCDVGADVGDGSGLGHVLSFLFFGAMKIGRGLVL